MLHLDMLHLDMGRYARFVWPAWGLSLAVVGGLTIQTFVNAKKAARELARREEAARARPPESGAEESGAVPGGKGARR